VRGIRSLGGRGEVNKKPAKPGNRTTAKIDTKVKNRRKKGSKRDTRKNADKRCLGLGHSYGSESGRVQHKASKKKHRVRRTGFNARPNPQRPEGHRERVGIVPAARRERDNRTPCQRRVMGKGPQRCWKEQEGPASTPDVQGGRVRGPRTPCR